MTRIDERISGSQIARGQARVFPSSTCFVNIANSICGCWATS